MPKRIFTIGLLSALTFVGSTLADDYDKKTVLTVNEPLLVPGQAVAAWQVCDQANELDLKPAHRANLQ
ncbi:MAG: hypothetical protein WDO18_12255 [Acidobacteriota bacterium]